MLAALVIGYATVRGLSGHIDEFQLTLEAVDLADRTGDIGLRVAMRAGATYPRWCAGELADGLRIADEGIELTGGDPRVGAGIAYACPYGALELIRGLLLGSLGRLSEGFAGLERALEAERAVNDLDVRGWVLLAYAYLAHWAGSGGEVAVTRARRGVEVTERTGAAFSQAMAYGALGEAYLLGGEWDEALAACSQALAIMHGKHINLEMEGLVHSRIARARLGAGRVAEARRAAEPGVHLSCERGHRIAEVQARTALAQVLLAEDAPDTGRIRRELNQALELAERTGFLSYQPQIHLRLAELARVVGDETAAAEAFDLAYRQFSAIGADGWLKRLAAGTAIRSR